MEGTTRGVCQGSTAATDKCGLRFWSISGESGFILVVFSVICDVRTRFEGVRLIGEIVNMDRNLTLGQCD